MLIRHLTCVQNLKKINNKKQSDYSSPYVSVPAKMGAIMKIAKDVIKKVIEDGSEAMGAN